MSLKITPQPIPLLQRVEKLEKRIEQMTEGVNELANRLTSSVTSALEVLDATIAVVNDLNPGTPLSTLIEEKITARRHEKAVARAEQEKKQITQLLESGHLKAIDKISKDSLIVGRVFNTEGKVMGVGREQIEFNQLVPELQSMLLGQEVGFMAGQEGKDKLEILEIYELVSQSDVSLKVAEEPTTCTCEVKGDSCSGCPTPV